MVLPSLHGLVVNGGGGGEVNVLVVKQQQKIRLFFS